MQPKSRFNFAGTAVKLESIKKTPKIKSPVPKEENVETEISAFF